MQSNSHEFAIIDVETSNLADGEIPKTKFWGYADSSGYKKFKTCNQLLRFLERIEPKKILHHSNFDVIQMLIDGARISVLKSHNGRLIKCVLGKHILINTFSVFPISLGQIFSAFSYKKTELSELEKRNYDDCVLGLKCFIELDEMFFGLCGISALAAGTIAATGFRAAERVAGRLPKNLSLVESYRGGRVELFRKDSHVCDKYDISSSYPKSFLDCPIKSELLFIEVSTKDYYCPLFDARNFEMLVFPNGKFFSYVYSDVLEKYLEPNFSKTNIRIIKRHKIDLSWIFNLKEFINKIYNQKENCSGGLRLVCKLLLNSLYGRIGLKGASERVRILDYHPDGDDISYYYFGKRRWMVFDSIFREPRSNYPLAAYITDNARGRLYQSFVQNDASYGDTDSVFVSGERKKFVGNIGTRCGEWRHEGREIFHGYNVKDYEFGREIVRKGGENFLKWTLKQFAGGKNVESVRRTRRFSLSKRVELADGSTLPLIIGK